MALIDHLRIEEEYLYPKLLKSKDRPTIEIAKKFSDEILKIPEKSYKFFDRYAHITIPELDPSKEFKRDLSEISHIVNRRINIEEEILYSLIDKNPK